MKHLDLFAGIGGFSEGLAGISQAVAACEIQPTSRAIYRANHPGVPIVDDIKAMKGDAFGPVDIVCAGFPCQPWSVGNRQRPGPKGLDDPRGAIIWEMLRVIREASPKHVIMENVSGIKKFLPHLRTIFNREGYRLKWKDWNLHHDLGLAQRRRRFYLVAWKDGTMPFEFPKPKPGRQQVLHDILDLHPDPSYDVPAGTWDYWMSKFWLTGRGTVSFCPIVNELHEPIFTFTKTAGSDARRFLVSTPGKERPRRLTISEIKRSMGFPEDYAFPVSRTRALQALGNAVSPVPIRLIGQAIQAA